MPEDLFALGEELRIQGRTGRQIGDGLRLLMHFSHSWEEIERNMTNLQAVGDGWVTPVSQVLGAQ
jgi:hypothetical protein